MVKIKLDLEKSFLAIFFVIFLFIGPGIMFDHRIKHDFPYAYFASDTFQHQVRAEAIKDMGNFRYEAKYISKGFENAIGRYPPVLYHLTVVLSNASGVETYDVIYSIVVLFAILAAFVMYYIVRNFNLIVALLSLPVSLLIFSSGPSIGFLWGHWPSLLAQFFLIAFFWSIMRIDLDKSYVLIAFFLSALILTHGSEAIFGIMVTGLFFGIKLLVGKLEKSDIKNLVFAFIIFFVISSYFLVIFVNIWIKTQPYAFSVEPVWSGNPGFYIAGFGLLLVPMFIGLIFSLLRFKELNFALIMAFAMLISGFLNYVGFGLRSFQLRFFWPIYLSALFGFGIYILFKFIIKKWNIFYAYLTCFILLFLFSGLIKLPILKQTEIQSIPSIPQLRAESNPGIMDPFHWEAFKWISKDTEENAKIYFFYGDIYSQDALLRNSKRVHYQVDVDDFINSIQERKIKKEYVSEFPGDSGGGIVYRQSLFKFENNLKNLPPEYSFGPKNICNFDYFVFDKFSGQQDLAKHNLVIASELLKKDYIKIVFENEGIVILKNSRPGDECIEERNF